MKKILSTFAIGCIAFAMSGILTPAVARQTFKPGKTISSQLGKWKQPIKEMQVRLIECQIRRVSGENDTYINFRFGDDGQTFPGGKRFPVTSTEVTTISVPGNGMSPNGQPLVINAYKGAVELIAVIIHYQ